MKDRKRRTESCCAREERSTTFNQPRNFIAFFQSATASSLKINPTLERHCGGEVDGTRPDGIDTGLVSNCASRRYDVFAGDVPQHGAIQFSEPYSDMRQASKRRRRVTLLLSVVQELTRLFSRTWLLPPSYLRVVCRRGRNPITLLDRKGPVVKTPKKHQHSRPITYPLNTRKIERSRL
jgi:hypothetical protein